MPLFSRKERKRRKKRGQPFKKDQRTILTRALINMQTETREGFQKPKKKKPQSRSLHNW